MVPSLHLSPSRHFVIPTGGRNLLVADTVTLQSDSRFLYGFAVSE
jgi:hypothetical protein